MLAMSTGGLGYSLNPIKAVKSVARSTVKVTKAVGRGTVSATKAVGHGTVKVVKTAGKVVVAPFAWVGTKLTAPIRTRVHKLRDRRAVKLAWDKRKSKQPNAAERAEAKSWTQSRLKSSGPHGHVLALFAGAPMPYYTEPAQLGLDPATASVIAASIPVMIAVLNAILNKSAASGEAPADPGADMQAEQQAAQEVAALAAETPGAVDMTAMQDQMVDSASNAEDGGGGGGGGGGGQMPAGPGMVRVPGFKTPIKQSHILIGGIVLGGLVLVSMLTRKKD